MKLTWRGLVGAFALAFSVVGAWLASNATFDFAIQFFFASIAAVLAFISVVLPLMGSKKISF